MAGTDRSAAVASNQVPPVVILVRPQLGENIGMSARAMLNCAVTELRLVAPRDGWPSETALAAASGAGAVIENARLYPTVKEAVADLNYVLATTARARNMAKPVVTPVQAAHEIRVRHAGGTPVCGLLFGPERAGLENDEVAAADAILNIPLNPGFSSLNLAQAVLLACHAWLSSDNPFTVPETDLTPAPRAEVDGMLKQLEDELSTAGFFRSADQKPAILRNIRNFFFRSAPTEQEVRTLRGIISSLTGKRSLKQKITD